MGFDGEIPEPCMGGSHLPPPPPGCTPRSSPSSPMYPSTTRWDDWAVSAVPLEGVGGGDELGLPPQPPSPRPPSSLSTGRVGDDGGGGGGGGYDGDPGPPRIHCPGSSAAPLSSATRISSSKSNGGETVAKASPGRLSPSEVKYSASVASCYGASNRGGLAKKNRTKNIAWVT